MCCGRINDTIPRVILDLRYSTNNNFTNKVVCESNEAFLRHEPLKYLKQAEAEFYKSGYLLVVFDAYRSNDTQIKLREVMDDSRYVAQTSNHSRGVAVDITLSDKLGNKLDMGTDFDDFTDKAHSNYGKITKEQRLNRTILASIMKKNYFVQYKYEWWHFDFMPQKNWPILNLS